MKDEAEKRDMYKILWCYRVTCGETERRKSRYNTNVEQRDRQKTSG